MCLFTVCTSTFLPKYKGVYNLYQIDSINNLFLTTTSSSLFSNRRWIPPFFKRRMITSSSSSVRVEKTHHRVFLALGSNVSSPPKKLQRSLDHSTVSSSDDAPRVVTSSSASTTTTCHGWLPYTLHFTPFDDKEIGEEQDLQQDPLLVPSSTSCYPDDKISLATTSSLFPPPPTTRLPSDFRVLYLECAVALLRRFVGEVVNSSSLFASAPAYIGGGDKEDINRMMTTTSSHGSSGKSSKIKGTSITSQDYINAVVEVTTHLSPFDLLYTTQYIEFLLGRSSRHRHHRTHSQRSTPSPPPRNGDQHHQLVLNSPRRVDIDILVYDDITIDSPALTIPHPRLHERNFVLFPFHQIDPNYCIRVKRKHQVKSTVDHNSSSSCSSSRNSNYLSNTINIHEDAKSAPQTVTELRNLNVKYYKEMCKKVETGELNRNAIDGRFLYPTKYMALRCDHLYELSDSVPPLLMGVLNVTPDSFLDGVESRHRLEESRQVSARRL